MSKHAARRPSRISCTDLFCGAGGSSLGAEAAGVSLVMAVNHWDRAIETHQTNFHEAAHDCRSVSDEHPSRYPSTDVLWASPECTAWSGARGKRRNFTGQLALDNEFEPLPSAAEERSRATMWDVVRFSEYHDYRAVVVENVVDIWGWGLLPVWFQAMERLGYEHRTLWLNSQFFGVPQSRDRVYVIFWKRGNRRPDLEFRPSAYCPRCRTVIEGIQSWKRRDRQAGRFRSQYVYRCPACTGEAAPYVTPAAAAIDWSLRGERIGDRKKPLAPATLARIEAGIDRYWRRPVVVDTLRDPKPRVAFDEPLVTQTGRQSLGLYLPPLIPHLRGTSTGQIERSAQTWDDPLGTVTAGGQHHGLVDPPEALYVKNYGPAEKAGPMACRVSQPLGSVTTVDHHALLEPPACAVARSTEEAMHTRSITTTTGPVAPVNGRRKRNGGGQVRSTGPPMTQTADLHRALVTSYYSRPDTARPAEEPMATVTSEPRHAFIEAPDAFLSSYYGEATDRRVSHTVGALTGQDRHALLEGPAIRVEDCSFRMLVRAEIQLGMGFDRDYVVLGNQREQVRQLGQGVTPPVAQWIVSRIVESLR